jgi:hypothetical protein
MAKRILQIVGMVFRYSVAHGICKRNPASEIRPSDILKPTSKTNMARIDAKELLRCSVRLSFMREGI